MGDGMSGPLVVIRDEMPGDRDAVRHVHEAAFDRRDEADLVEYLHADRDTIRSLVAIAGAHLVGHVLFSRVWIEGEEPRTLASLAPVAVQPEWQRRGVGSTLILKGIEACRADGWPGIIVVGAPSYYARFGFASQAVGHLASPYAGDAFMGLELEPGAMRRLHGAVRYPAAFSRIDSA
jgi:putative acetyltransferase